MNLEPGTVVRYWQPARTVVIERTFDEVLVRGSFDHIVGTVAAITVDGEVVGKGRVTSADVAEDGSGVWIAYQVMDL